MSNPLSARRVMVQTIDATGAPEGPPSFGVVVSDNEVSLFTDSFDSLGELNDYIEDMGSIVDVVDDGQFSHVNRSVVGVDNYYGTDYE